MSGSDTHDKPTEDLGGSGDETIGEPESPRRVRLPTKDEIIEAVDNVETESIPDELIPKEAPQDPQVLPLGSEPAGSIDLDRDNAATKGPEPAPYSNVLPLITLGLVVMVAVLLVLLFMR